MYQIPNTMYDVNEFSVIIRYNHISDKEHKFRLDS